ncbi:MFS transporter [Persephonella sp.]
MKKPLPNTVIIINLITFFLTVSYEMIFSVLPFFLVNTIGVSMFVIGIIEGGYDLISNFVKIFSGYWSDFFNRKRMIVWAIVTSILSRMYFILGKKWDDFVIAVTLEAVSEGSFTPVKDTILSSEKRKNLGKTFGINRAIENIGSFLGILIALIFFSTQFLDYQEYFYLSIVPLILAMVLIIFLKIPQEKKIRKIRIVTWEIFFPKYIILFFLLSFANFGYSFYILKIYEQIKNEAFTVSIYLIFSIIIGVAALLSGRLFDRLGEKKHLEITVSLFLLSHLLMIFVPIAGFILFAFADAFLDIGIWATLGRKVRFRKGFVFGMYHFTVGFSSLIAGMVAGYLWESIDAEAPFVMGIIASSIAFFIIKRYF